MRRVVRIGIGIALSLSACHAPGDSGDGGMRGRTVIDDSDDRPPDAALDASANIPENVKRASLVALDGGAPKRAKDGAVLLCRVHSVWTPPDGFALTQIGEGVAARMDDRLVAITFPPHADDSYATSVARFVSGAIAWDAPSMKTLDDWHAEATVHGRASNLVFAVRTLYAGVDPKTGKGRPGRTIETPSADVIWIAAAPTEKEADDLLEGARTGTLTLVDHACACGYDCMPPRR